ncbi:RNA recognition motif domain-containing protein [Thiohalomonas denitrificans]|uniref:RNA recognition motif. (A.k.a. RRM, RBD, or RNP domain) n=1 Tax=Thiohalomonas denitrificans TaxID=415747 RepID=A0A1G5QRN6_9GAMM|nr:RNA-binding protein [Thiohalomonas denitrificans]SCZ64306.1 RNA recognition motif. (a.k.a. RRM, RBD, or RNP domain) [Thiohalomonas denitrificans]
MQIFVGNLPDSITGDDLRRFFRGYGRCSGFLIINKLVEGRINHCAYGVIEPDPEARRAIRELHQRELKGRPVEVTEHTEPERRRPRRMPWRGPDRRRRRPWLAQPLIVDDRRKTERRSEERREQERRAVDRRSPVQRQPPSSAGETPFIEQRVAQRRVAERRRGERRRQERRS